MNPTTREQKKNIVKILNEADVDPETGDSAILPIFFATLTPRFRGRHRAPIAVHTFFCRHTAQRFQGRCTKRSHKDLGCIHWRDKVGFRFNQQPFTKILLNNHRIAVPLSSLMLKSHTLSSVRCRDIVYRGVIDISRLPAYR